MATLKENFDYYLEHQEEFVRQHNGKVVVIKDRKLLGTFDDEASAVAVTQKTHPLGTFLVQRVAPGNSAYTQVFHSRVRFA